MEHRDVTSSFLLMQSRPPLMSLYPWQDCLQWEVTGRSSREYTESMKQRLEQLWMGEKKNPPKPPTFSQEFHVCSGYWRQFKTFPTFAITPCKHFPSSPQSSALGSQHSHVTWQTKKYFLPNQPSAALVRWLFPHFIPYNLQSLLLKVQTENANFLCHAS